MRHEIAVYRSREESAAPYWCEVVCPITGNVLHVTESSADPIRAYRLAVAWSRGN